MLPLNLFSITLDLEGFHRGVVLMAGLFILGGVVSAIGISNKQVKAVPGSVNVPVAAAE
jgi:hypothetical protein